MIAALSTAGQVAGAEVSVKLSAVGQALIASADLPGGGNAHALAGARKIADAAYAAGARMNLDIEDHTTIDQTLEVLFELRRTHPDIGIAIQSMLLRTPKDLAELSARVQGPAGEGGLSTSRPSVAFTDPGSDRPGLRAGDEVPDARQGISDDRLARPADDRHRRQAGRRRRAQPRPVGTPDAVRDPAGRAGTAGQGRQDGAGVRAVRADWYAYFTRRLAERPANLLFFLRSLRSRG